MALLLATRVAAAGWAAAFFALRAPFARTAESVPVTHSEEDAAEQLVKGAVGVGAVLPLLWAVAPHWFSSTTTAETTALRFGLGCAILALGNALFLATHLQLGRNYSATLQIRAQHALVVDGVYRYVRHPMYAAFFMHALGNAVLVPAPVVGLVYAAAIVVLCVLRLAREERMLAKQFGAEYAQYSQRTARFIPFVL